MNDRSRVPDLLIAGAQKSGTTTLHSWLRDHPDVFMAAPKELHYFDRHYDKGPQWYADHFGAASQHQIAGEATPDYMYLASAVCRMASDLPSARLVVLLRDPIDRAYSHYHHSRSRGLEPLSFRQALAAEPERLRDAASLAPSHFSYVDRGRYAHQLHRLFDLYPREAVLVDLFENLRDRPLETYQRLASHAGIDGSFVPATVGARANRYKSQRLRRLRKKFPKAKPLRHRVARLDTLPVRSYPPMDPEDRDRLASVYEAERHELATLIDCDLSVWRS